MKAVSAGYPIRSIKNIPVYKDIFCSSAHYTRRTSRKISYIVIHYTGNAQDSALANAKYYSSADARDASAHYFVDDNECYQSVALNDIAWAVGAKSYRHRDCRNSNSVSIEMCTSGKYSVSGSTIENTAQLCALVCRYLDITDIDTYVLRHYDVTGKACPAMWAKENQPGWDAFKKRVKEILSEGDIDMEELKRLQKQAEELTAQISDMRARLPKVYHYTQDVPEWGRATVQKLLDKGVLSGAAQDDLNLSEDLLRMLVIIERMTGLENG